jgi:hypothetical protein
MIKSWKMLSIYLFIFWKMTNFCIATEANHEGLSIAGQEKIYVSHDQIVMTDQGIFLLVEEDSIPISELRCDASGIYIPSIMAWTKEKCPNGHDITCRRCYGCNWRRKCVYACDCGSDWRRCDCNCTCHDNQQ